MDDLIRRSDAIKAVEERSFAVRDSYTVKAILRNVPSADSEVVGKLKAAIESEEICKNCPTAERISGENLLGAMALGFSYGMEADRPQGYWATRGKCEFRCSKCGKIIYADCENERNYCPNCGSKNRINLLLKWDDMPLKGADDGDN